MSRLPATMLVLLVLSACPRGPAGPSTPAPSPPAAPAVAAPAEDCTGATPLREGVPGSPGHLVASPLNPNGMSELALLMRRMVSDLEAARDVIERGGTPAPVGDGFRRIRCAWPTEPGMRTPEFDPLAVGYLRRVAEMDADPAHARARYTAVLAGCRACHEATCDGPLSVIDGLALREK